MIMDVGLAGVFTLEVAVWHVGVRDRRVAVLVLVRGAEALETAARRTSGSVPGP